MKTDRRKEFEKKRNIRTNNKSAIVWRRLAVRPIALMTPKEQSEINLPCGNPEQILGYPGVIQRMVKVSGSRLMIAGIWIEKAGAWEIDDSVVPAIFYAF